ncbi:MAG TPA: DUF302 domain-containing protein [Candidatus Acidoferrum sp.]|nr:DUF302 domain-containing protein [Candidatus Acidoferrum sp.]
MATKQISVGRISVERFSVTSTKPFDEVVKALEASVGHPNLGALVAGIASAKSFAEVEKLVNDAAGASGLMQFMRFDLGEVVHKERGAGTPRSVRYLIGNPLTMKRMLERTPDAGSYAPVTILADERPDGVRLTYDRMASFLATYGSEEALRVARDLDAKIEAILMKAAA